MRLFYKSKEGNLIPLSSIPYRTAWNDLVYTSLANYGLCLTRKTSRNLQRAW